MQAGLSFLGSLAAAAGVVLVGALVLRDTSGPTASRPERPVVAPEPTARGTVYAIALPEAPPVIPDGPNRPQFEAYCRLCHSPRLILTQPQLTEKQWGAVVKKMVTAYGAPVPPEQEPGLVAYLMAVRGAGH